MNIIELGIESGLLHPAQQQNQEREKALERFAALVRAEALAEPVKQEPVLWGNDKFAPHERPVDAKAIRAEAFEEAAKVCENIEPPYWTETRNKCAAAIRGLK